MIGTFAKKSAARLVTLRFTILSVFICLILVTTLSTIIIRSIVFSHELTISSFQTLKYAATEVQHEILGGIRPAALQGQFAATLLANDVLTAGPMQLADYSYFLLKTMPLAQRAYWADEHGDYIYSIKENNGSITTAILSRSNVTLPSVTIHRDPAGNVLNPPQPTVIDYDPRHASWYQDAKQLKRFFWTDITVFEPNPHVGIGAISPVLKKDGQFIGLFGINISLHFLTQFISNLYVSPNGYAFIILGNEKLVAYPNRGPFVKLPQPDPNKFISVHTESLPLIDVSIDRYKRTGKKELVVEYAGQTYLITYLPVKDIGQDWLIGVVAPQTDFTRALERMNLLTIEFSLIVLLLGIIIVSNIVTRIVKPINALVDETEKIKRFDLDQHFPIQSRIKEVVELRDAIQSMKVGLRSFQRYVPKILVRQLIGLGEDIRVGGIRKHLVVFFSDIQNFTTIAENMDPNVLTVQLCEYFEELTRIIIDEKGTIDKYIGDSIMAFWGAPLTEENPAMHAARAALRCQMKIEEMNLAWQKHGKPALITRIGINAGEAVVGNLGSSERLNYTAFGDTVNIANRLESINKIYHTHILVSDAVYQQIKDQFVLRRVDEVAVKGKTEHIFIYELLAEDPNQLSFDIQAYIPLFDKAFSAYKEGDFPTAIRYFKQCLLIYPEDTLAPFFIEKATAAL